MSASRLCAVEKAHPEQRPEMQQRCVFATTVDRSHLPRVAQMEGLIAAPDSTADRHRDEI